MHPEKGGKPSLVIRIFILGHFPFQQVEILAENFYSFEDRPRLFIRVFRLVARLRIK